MKQQPNPLTAAPLDCTIRWTRDKVIAFIQTLAADGSVASAARAVGMSRKAAYALRRRLGPGFAGAWDAARDMGRERRRTLRRGYHEAAR